MKKAEEAALKAYPDEMVTTLARGNKFRAGPIYRSGFIQGYEQAEKDLVPIIDRLTEAILFDWPNMDEVAKEAAIEIALNHHE